jgi:hypothetical protein
MSPAGGESLFYSGRYGLIEIGARGDSMPGTGIVRSSHNNFARTRVVGATSVANPGKLPICAHSGVFSGHTRR